MATLLTAAAYSHAADWNLPITITSGTSRTGAVLGIHSNATNSFDAGLDTPTPFSEETLCAYFNHPEWNITTAGTPLTTFHRDIRGTLPQTFSLSIKSAVTPTTITWNNTTIPTTVKANLTTNGQTINMTTTGTYTFTPASQLTIAEIEITAGDSTPPSPPTNLQYNIKGTSIYLSWDTNTESDLQGYKLHLLDSSGNTTRSVDLKKVTNYNLMNVINDQPYNLAVSAYDTTGNESTKSTIITAIKVTPPTTPAGADGDIDKDGSITITDAIKVLRMALNLDITTADAITHGDMDSDGKLTVRDALQIIRKSVGLI